MSKQAEQMLALGELAKEAQANKWTPTQLLSKMYDAAPDGVRQFIDARASEVLGIEIPKMALVVQAGFVLDRDDDEFTPLVDIFDDSMKAFAGKAPELTATIVECGRELAIVMDTAVRRVLLEDTEINREAYLDLLAAHAKILRSYVGLTQLPPSESSGEQSD